MAKGLDRARVERFHPGEEVPTGPTADFRNPYQHDRDRLLYSWSVRRLGGVTQVVQAAEGHVVHNRLIHSLKVAQVGKRLAQYFQFNNLKSNFDDYGGLDATVVEAAGLAHDLGHPPFGHIAEDELDKAIREIGTNPSDRLYIDDDYLAEGYEGNAQSFRIVTSVAPRKLTRRGLHLTRAVLKAVLKYPNSRALNPKDRAHKKFGYYSTEADAFSWVWGASRPTAPSLEAAIMDYADDVTYSTHDVDDFYRAGLIPLDQILYESKERESFIESTHVQFMLGKRGADSDVAKATLDRIAKVAGGTELRRPYTGRIEQMHAMDNFVSSLLTDFLHVPSKKVTGTPSVSLGDPKNEPLVRNPQAALMIDLLKRLTWHYVIDNPGLAVEQAGQRRIVRSLFREAFRAAQSNNLAILPTWVQEKVRSVDNDLCLEMKANEVSKEYMKARIAADYVASMTEMQAITTYGTLMGIDGGGLLGKMASW